MGGALGSAVIDPGLFFRLSTVITIIGGTVFLLWLGEQITQRGIGNGISLIIFAGIVANLPSAIAGTFELVRTGALSPFFIIALIFFIAVNFYIYSLYGESPEKNFCSISKKTNRKQNVWWRR